MTIENVGQNGYWSAPTIVELKSLNTEDLRSVKDFRAGKTHVGSIHFTQAVDLTDIDLDSLLGGLISFEHGSCTVYPIESDTPPMGQGLNVPATIELCNLQSRVPNATPLQRLIQKLQSVKYTHFMDYNRTLHRWTFGVQHFTRYEFPTIEDEDETMLDVVEHAIEDVIESPSILAATATAATAAIAVLDRLDDEEEQKKTNGESHDHNMLAENEPSTKTTSGPKRTLQDMAESLSTDSAMNDINDDSHDMQVSYSDRICV